MLLSITMKMPVNGGLPGSNHVHVPQNASQNPTLQRYAHGALIAKGEQLALIHYFWMLSCPLSL